jgi:hypothetical protein
MSMIILYQLEIRQRISLEEKLRKAQTKLDGIIQDLQVMLSPPQQPIDAVQVKKVLQDVVELQNQLRL